MSQEHPDPVLELPVDMNEFIDRIDEMVSDESKQHLKDIVEMVREGAPEEWKEAYTKGMAFYQKAPQRAAEMDAILAEDFNIDSPISLRRELPPEFYWLEAAVLTAQAQGYLSDVDEKRTRWILVQAQKV